MSSSYVSAELRRLVVARAEGHCEYCLIHEDDTFFGCEVDHIISEKHGGPTESENLALACFTCNRRKGSDVGSVTLENASFTRFYHPRSDRWSDHCALSADVLLIEPRTEVGTVTARILGFNDVERQIERDALQRVGRYPLPGVLRRALGST